MNYFQKNTAIMDLKEHVLSYNMIFIKEHLLYLPNNILQSPKEMKLEMPEEIKKTKTSFLVFKHQKYTTVNTNDIAFFFIRNETVSMMCFDQQEYTLNQSLDQIMNSVSSAQFFRVNRKYLINFKAIKEVEHYFLRKLFVRLLMDTPDKLLINKEKTNVFLSWMSDR
jgi:DNA-binding LytR/AlgR family response regulator